MLDAAMPALRHQPSPLCRWLHRFSSLTSTVAIALLLLVPLLSPTSAQAQTPGGPGQDGPVVTTPPQMVCLGNSLKSMRDDFLVPHLLARHPVTSLRFQQVIDAGGSAVYMGGLLVSGDPAPLALGQGPPLAPTSIARWGYLHQDSTAPPDLAEDTFVVQVTPIAATNRTRLPIISSVLQLDLLIQVCDWMQPGQTPVELQPIHDWLQQSDSTLDGVECWQQKRRVFVRLSGQQANPSGEPLKWRSTISWQATSNGGHVDLEVQP